MVQKGYAFCRNSTSGFESGSSSGLVIGGPILSGDAGQGQHSSQPVATRSGVTEGQECFCPHTAILSVTFSAVFNTLHEIVNTLLSDRLGERWLRQLQGNVSVLST